MVSSRSADKFILAAAQNLRILLNLAEAGAGISAQGLNFGLGCCRHHRPQQYGNVPLDGHSVRGTQ